MRSSLSVSLLVLSALLPISLCQLSTIGISNSGASNSKTISSTLSSSASATITSTSTIETSSTKPGDPLVLTTIFTAPSGCDNGYSGLVAATDYMFKNVMNPASGVLISSCYPSQFFTSAMATSSLGPYKQLVCPSGWTTGQYNSTYVYCCPRNYRASGINSTNVQRPAAEAICYTRLPPEINLFYTVFDAQGNSTIITTSVGTNGAMALATLFDGTPGKTTVSKTSSATSQPTSFTTSQTLSSAKPSKTLTPDNSCGNTGDGNNKGYTCNQNLAGGGPCCSKGGYCGKTGAYCGSGCQGGFGTCGTLTQDNTCGLTGAGNNKGYMCSPSLANGGSCCSANGDCGNTSGYCGSGCQTGYGTCN